MHSDLEGRFVVVDLVFPFSFICIINIYASNVENEKKVFFSSLSRWCVTGCVLIGDWNVHLACNDPQVDLWRALHPDDRTFSRRQVVLGSLKQSRIEYCLADAIRVNLISSASKRSRGGTQWVFISSLLQDEDFILDMSALIDTKDLQSWWTASKRERQLCGRVEEEALRYEQDPHRGAKDFLGFLLARDKASGYGKNILALLNEHGVIMSDEFDKVQALTDFYAPLFTLEVSDHAATDYLLFFIEHMLGEDDRLACIA